MIKKGVVITLLLIVSVNVPIEAAFFAPLASAFGSSFLSENQKGFFKDAMDFSDIMGDLKVVNEDTRDRVSELLEHTQIMDEGDTFIDFAVDYAYNANPYIYVVDYELQYASEIVSKYVGKNYYDEVCDCTCDHARDCHAEHIYVLRRLHTKLKINHDDTAKMIHLLFGCWSYHPYIEDEIQSLRELIH